MLLMPVCAGFAITGLLAAGIAERDTLFPGAPDMRARDGTATIFIGRIMSLSS
jgi:hypothetical protein